MCCKEQINQSRIQGFNWGTSANQNELRLTFKIHVDFMLNDFKICVDFIIITLVPLADPRVGASSDCKVMQYDHFSVKHDDC